LDFGNVLSRVYQHADDPYRAYFQNCTLISGARLIYFILILKK